MIIDLIDIKQGNLMGGGKAAQISVIRMAMRESRFKGKNGNNIPPVLKSRFQHLAAEFYCPNENDAYCHVYCSPRS